MNTPRRAPSSASGSGDCPEPRTLTVKDLASLNFFDGLAEAQLALIAPHTMRSRFPADSMIFHEGDLANRFYVILTGLVSLEREINNRILKVADLGAGDALGFSWVFHPDKLHFTARVVEPVEAVFVYGTVLRTECETHPSLGYELAKRAGGIMLTRIEMLVTLIAERLVPARNPFDR